MDKISRRGKIYPRRYIEIYLVMQNRNARIERHLIDITIWTFWTK